MKDRSRREREGEREGEGEREREREGGREAGGEFATRVMEDAINNENREKKLEIGGGAAERERDRHRLLQKQQLNTMY